MLSKLWITKRKNCWESWFLFHSLLHSRVLAWLSTKFQIVPYTWDLRKTPAASCRPHYQYTKERGLLKGSTNIVTKLFVSPMMSTYAKTEQKFFTRPPLPFKAWPATRHIAYLHNCRLTVKEWLHVQKKYIKRTEALLRTHMFWNKVSITVFRLLELFKRACSSNKGPGSITWRMRINTIIDRPAFSITAQTPSYGS